MRRASDRTDAGVATAYVYGPGRHWLTQAGQQSRSYDAAGNTTRINRGGNTDTPQPGDPGGPPGSGTTARSALLASGTARAASASVTAAVREFVYDDANRLRQVKHDGVVAMNYLYNGRGEQVYKTGSSKTVITVYDEAGHWIADYDAYGNAIQQAIWLDDLPVGLLVGAGAAQKLYYIEADALGTPRVVIDPDRNVAVWKWDLANEAFGDSAPNEDPDGDGIPFVFDMRMPGQRWDSATGMSQNYFRDYDASVGRYAQSDPIGLKGGISTFSYVGGNSLVLADIFGLRPGDCYKSADIAAANALTEINPTSISENREYAGWIYKTANGYYSYTAPRQGDSDGSSPGVRHAGAVGSYHTHGAWDLRFVVNGVDGNEMFSSPIFGGNDLNIPIGDYAYLGTPHGKLLSYRNGGNVASFDKLKPASPNNQDSCGCGGKNSYEDIGQRIWRFLKGDW